MDQDYYFPAEITSREMSESAEVKLREVVKADLGGVAPYLFPAEISSNRLDSHFTHMLDSTLRNFANESEIGVSFLDSHQRRRLGLGYTLTGAYEKDNGVTRVTADVYTVPGIDFGDGSYASTDDFIRAVRARLVRKVSVGFHGGDMICDICGNSLWDWRNCRHWPGRKYTINGDNGEDGEEVVATFGVEDAHLAEVSAVYEGSTPGAMIIRAEGMAQAGLLDGEEIRSLETQYRIKLSTGQRTWPVEKEIQANGEKQQMEGMEQVLEALKKAGAPEDPAKMARWIADIGEENTRLVALAKQGEQYRADTIEAALAEGVRALGDDFHTETYKKMFDSAEIDHIKRMSGDWKRQGDLLFKGKRKTVDDEQQTPAPAPISAVPDAAFKS